MLRRHLSLIFLAGTLFFNFSVQGAQNPFTEIQEIPTGEAPNSVAFSPTGKLAAIINQLSSNIALYSINNEGQFTLTQSISVPDYPQDLLFSPSGKTIVVCNNNPSSPHLSVYKVGPNGLTSIQNTGDGSFPYHLLFSPKGDLLITLNTYGNSISLYGVSSSGLLTPMQNIPTAGAPVSADFSSTGELLAIKFSATKKAPNSNVSLYKVSGGQLTLFQTIPDNGETAPEFGYVAFTPSGNLVVTRPLFGEIHIYEKNQEMGKYNLLQTVSQVADANAIAFSPSGSLAAVVNDNCDNTLSIFTIDPTTGLFTLDQTIATGRCPSSISFNTKNPVAAVTNPVGNTLSIYRVNESIND